MTPCISVRTTFQHGHLWASDPVGHLLVSCLNVYVSGTFAMTEDSLSLPPAPLPRKYAETPAVYKDTLPGLAWAAD